MSLHSLQELETKSDDELIQIIQNGIEFERLDRQEWQLLYYKPNTENHLKVHLSRAHLMGAGGGNRSGKTESALVEACIRATGVIPESLREIWPRQKFRGPINVRVVCESHTTTLVPVILYKLQYTNWSGVDIQGGERGHWGWIPKSCLMNERWEDSWKDSKRQLTVLCRNPDNLDEVLGHSVFQFMSRDQDPAKFASGEFHFIVMDEPPTYAIFRENRARAMSVGGTCMLAMTWPDDPAIPVDWIFNEVYDPGSPGPNKDPDIDWIEFDTTKNPHIDQERVVAAASKMSERERACRIQGKPIRFSNLIHPLFTDSDSYWCFTCCEEVLAGPDLSCTKCLGDDVVSYNHVQEFDIEERWPVVYILDPHPRKPHMMQWVAVDGNDDYSVLYCAEVEDEPDEVKKVCDQIERQFHFNVCLRLMDPNMGASPSGSRREVSWQDEFANAGIPCELASDSDVGRSRVNEYLKPDYHTRRPRLRWHIDYCKPAIYQMKRFAWDDFKHAETRDQKQKPKPKYDDYPALARYLMNAEPSCQMLKFGPQIIRPKGQMVSGY